MAELLALRAGRPLPPQEDSWYSFMLQIESTQGHNAAGKIRSIEKYNDIGARTRDFPVLA
jgi:hypothetical protein